jgi:hypothetical protein
MINDPVTDRYAEMAARIPRNPPVEGYSGKPHDIRMPHGSKDGQRANALVYQVELNDLHNGIRGNRRDTRLRPVWGCMLLGLVLMFEP